MRKLFIAGNWKMNMLSGEAVALASGLKETVGEQTDVDVAVCPPFPSLTVVRDAVAGSVIALGAQNMHWEASGAFTGEVSAAMLKDAGCAYVILGHSERRQMFGETSEIVNRKVKAAIAAGLKPIVCVGETIEERKSDKTTEVVTKQVKGSLANLGADEMAEVTVAYEPIWAIGTGLTPSPDQADAVHVLIRSVLAGLSTDDVAEGVRIQYGGSVKPGNAKEFLAQTDIDGALVGGASLKVDAFTGIIEAGLAQ